MTTGVGLPEARYFATLAGSPLGNLETAGPGTLSVWGQATLPTNEGNQVVYT